MNDLCFYHAHSVAFGGYSVIYPAHRLKYNGRTIYNMNKCGKPYNSKDSIFYKECEPYKDGYRYRKAMENHDYIIDKYGNLIY